MNSKFLVGFLVSNLFLCGVSSQLSAEVKDTQLAKIGCSHRYTTENGTNAGWSVKDDSYVINVPNILKFIEEAKKNKTDPLIEKVIKSESPVSFFDFNLKIGPSCRVDPAPGCQGQYSGGLVFSYTLALKDRTTGVVASTGKVEKYSNDAMYYTLDRMLASFNPLAITIGKPGVKDEKTGSVIKSVQTSCYKMYLSDEEKTELLK